MIDYSVHLTGRLAKQNKTKLTTELVFELLDRLDEATHVSPVATHKARNLTARINVKAADPGAAAAAALKIFNKATKQAGVGDVEIDAIETMTYAELKRRNKLPTYPEFIDTRGIATHLNLSLPTTTRKIVGAAHFPPAEFTLEGAGPVWRKDVISAYLKTNNITPASK